MSCRWAGRGGAVPLRPEAAIAEETPQHSVLATGEGGGGVGTERVPRWGGAAAAAAAATAVAVDEVVAMVARRPFRGRGGRPSDCGRGAAAEAGILASLAMSPIEAEDARGGMDRPGPLGSAGVEELRPVPLEGREEEAG